MTVAGAEAFATLDDDVLASGFLLPGAEEVVFWVELPSVDVLDWPLVRFGDVSVEFPSPPAFDEVEVVDRPSSEAGLLSAAVGCGLCALFPEALLSLLLAVPG